jgi:prenyltransferase beta subunit
MNTPSVSIYLSLDSEILHYPATNKKKRREYILDCLHQSMQGFSPRQEQEMSVSHHNMYSDGISYTVLDLFALRCSSSRLAFR